jgi:predicted phosphodiesterase
MKILVIPDIHLKTWIYDRADDILRAGKADEAVCLMDIPDDWDLQFQVELYRNTYDRAISFAKDHPGTLWCYGNHDISYIWGKMETGYSPYAENTVISKLEELQQTLRDPAQLAFMHRVGNVIFSHGGLTAAFVQSLKICQPDADIDDILKAVNACSPSQLWNDDSPLWLRPQDRRVTAFRSDTYTQVVGHTPVERIYEERGFISSDVFSTYRDGRQIGESAMLVIDSETREYTKVEVPKREG